MNDISTVHRLAMVLFSTLRGWTPGQAQQPPPQQPPPITRGAADAAPTAGADDVPPTATAV